MGAELIGWVSAAILASTISRQVYTQWRTKSVEGVSKWLFVGQLLASFGFTVYSYLVDNWVFVFTNFFIFLTAVAGELIYLGNRRRARRAQAAPANVRSTERQAASR